MYLVVRILFESILYERSISSRKRTTIFFCFDSYSTSIWGFGFELRIGSCPLLLFSIFDFCFGFCSDSSEITSCKSLCGSSFGPVVLVLGCEPETSRNKEFEFCRDGVSTISFID